MTLLTLVLVVAVGAAAEGPLPPDTAVPEVPKYSETAPGGKGAEAAKKAPEPTQLANTGTAPTVVCDDKGGYRPELYGHGIEATGGCMYEHEMVHVADYLKTCPDGCKGRKPGTPAPRDGDRCKPFTAAIDYNRWLTATECRAHPAELACLSKQYQGSTDDSLHGKIRARKKKVRAGWNNHRKTAKLFTPPVFCGDDE